MSEINWLENIYNNMKERFWNVCENDSFSKQSHKLSPRARIRQSGLPSLLLLRRRRGHVDTIEFALPNQITSGSLNEGTQQV
jgi:hypothetical protein